MEVRVLSPAFGYRKPQRMSERKNVKTTLSEREGNTVKLAVEVSSEELQEAFDARLKQAGRGSRASPASGQGKVPLTMVRQRVGDEAILVDAVEETMGALVRAGGARTGSRPGRQARDRRAATRLPELGKPFSFTATVTVMPEVELGAVQGRGGAQGSRRGHRRRSRRADGPAAQRVRRAQARRGPARLRRATS